MTKAKKGICVNCGFEKWLVNSKGMCAQCQKDKNAGLSSNELFKSDNKKSSDKILIKSKKRMRNVISNKRMLMIEKDEAMYEYIFNNTSHFCEECGRSLPDRFRDDDGNVIARWQYSHIASKGSQPELRHHLKNINRLCLRCHQIWEFGDKENMKIYKNNMKLVEEMLESLRK